MLGVRGMDNISATEVVSEVLQAVRGVHTVEAGNDGQAMVEYDSSELTVMDLIRALRQRGFLAGMA